MTVDNPPVSAPSTGPHRLSALDASFLAMERPTVPLHVASMGIFEGDPLVDSRGRIRIDHLRRQVAARLDLLPEFRRRLAVLPFGAGPVWVDDPTFDIAKHVETIRLPAPGDEAALWATAAELHATPLDRDRPLWHLCFITGLPDGRVALFERVHHAMVDGVSGVDVATLLLDTSPEVRRMTPPTWEPEPARPPWALATAVIRDRTAAAFGAAAGAVGALRHPTAVLQGTTDVGSALATLVRNGLRAPRSWINQPISGRRRLAVVRQRLEPIKAAGARVGATTNDVVLTAVADGFRDVFVARGEPLPADLSLKVLVPVSMRDSRHHVELGNQVGALFAPLPIGMGDPEERLEAITATTRELKAGREATTTDLALHAMNIVPPALTEALAGLVGRQPIISLVVTNVVGPPFPLYALGARLLEAIPIIPLGGNLTIGVAVMSYDGALVLEITVDPEVWPDLDVFVAGVQRGFGALGVKPEAHAPRDVSAS